MIGFLGVTVAALDHGNLPRTLQPAVRNRGLI